MGRPATTVVLPSEQKTAQKEIPEVADRRELVLSTADPLRLKTRVAGLFLFLPLLARMGFHKLVQKADYPGSKMVPADAALLSLLTLKLVDKERRSHIDDLNFEESLGQHVQTGEQPQGLLEVEVVDVTPALLVHELQR